MIHELSGWPSHASATNFENRFLSMTPSKDYKWTGEKWVAKFRGIGPQYYVDPNGTAFVLIGPEDLQGTPRRTWHGNDMNSFALGIENGNSGDQPGVVPGKGQGSRWWRLSTQSEDLTGMKAYLILHPADAVDAVLVWIAQFPHFPGSGDIIDGDNPATHRKVNKSPWNNMLFTERNYRTLALLCRLLAEQYEIPRNLPLLPYLDNSTDGKSAALFRKLILSDQKCDLIAHKLGIDTKTINANGAAFTDWYTSNNQMVPQKGKDGKPQKGKDGKIVLVFQSNTAWSRFFGVKPETSKTKTSAPDLPCFKGFLSHDINGGHPCPGPLFDWHRFAREIWDWWWYPFDVDPLGVVTVRRPYQQARRDTQLIDYYYDSLGTAADYTSLRPSPTQTNTLQNKFLLPERTPIYAMANGVIVAAQFALSSSPVSSGFVLARHEIFHRHSANPNRIDYDRPPTFVWSLSCFLENSGFDIPSEPSAQPKTTPIDNPDWLNRFIIRLRECELSVQFHVDNVGNKSLNKGWGHPPSGAGARLSTGEEIEQDATAYRQLARSLEAGKAALFPLESNSSPTSVRVILGDFLGYPNRMAENQTGVQIEIFSMEKLDDIPGATYRACQMSTEDWWRDASAAIRSEGVPEMNLPENGIAWHYDMDHFLEWMNGVTWSSEWEKYDMVDASGASIAAPPRPITRRVL